VNVAPRLLHCLLVLLLVVNGAGVRAAVTSQPIAAAPNATCHEKVAAGNVGLVDLAMPARPDPGDRPDPADCCAGGQCDGACTHAPGLPIAMRSIPRLAPPLAPSLAFVIAPVAEARGSPFRPPIV